MRGRKLYAIAVHAKRGSPGLWLWYNPDRNVAIFWRMREARAEASRIANYEYMQWLDGKLKHQRDFSVVPIWAEPTGEQAWVGFPMLARTADQAGYANEWRAARSARGTVGGTAP